MVRSLQAGFLTRILSQNAFPFTSGEQWLIVLRIPGRYRGERLQRRDRRGFSPRSLLAIHTRPLGGGPKMKTSFFQRTVGIIIQIVKKTKQKCSLFFIICRQSVRVGREIGDNLNFAFGNSGEKSRAVGLVEDAGV